MFGYYLDLALQSLKRNKVLTALMVLSIALGIGASITTLTVLRLVSGDPLPGISDTLYYPQIDPRDAGGIMPGEEPPEQVTLIDGFNLLRAKQADRQALMTGGSIPVQTESATTDPFYVETRFTTADFFAMFGAPFRYGRGWNEADDEAKARNVVISAKLNERLFGDANSVGRIIRLAGSQFRVVGVLGDWAPNPHFYDVTTGTYGYAEDVFIPLQSALDLHMQHKGSNDCWGNGTGGVGRIYPSPTCVWLQFWVQLDTPAKAASYKQFLIHYSEQQKTMGRFALPPNVRLSNVMEWLAYEHVVPGDVRLQTGLAFGFLLVCLSNTVGLMLAKFLRRASELSVRRALGASRRALFAQLLVESGVVGVVGGAGGLLLALFGLWVVRHRPSNYAAMAHLDPQMLLTTFLLALGASLLAGLLPAWRACQVAPALQLKNG
ncbi:ABC transporter permease [Dyella sp. LX-66]|uniref:ABC transporter permease n=1 Tax=unclassified Dyella TaxID=2634549 RepID=UPI001BE04F32|nr:MULTISPECIES: ABC transporter permease [unclassified Dyella]MBT2118870.1 ABC transporter permease [Dyella sp. LX-1]MBT2140137.1 ABC transporter permease [Dyella sp. LX-66]